MKAPSIIVGLLFTLMLGAPPAWGQELLANPTFDTGIEGWTTDGTGPGTISWDAGQGQPPGSLRFPDFDQVATTEECWQPQVGTYTLSTDAFMETSGEFVECLINFFLYLAPDCSDEPSPIIDVNGEGIFPYVTAPNEWQRLEFEFQVTQSALDQGAFVAIRPMLIKLGDFQADDACLYDNVSLTYAPPALAATQIPTVESLGLSVLAALLGVAGLIVLRRRFPQ